MKKPAVLLISGWAHGAEAMHPLADAMGTPIRSFHFRLPNFDSCKAERKGEDSQRRAQFPRMPARFPAVSMSRASPHVSLAGRPGGIVAIEAAANYPQKVCCPGASEHDSAVLLLETEYTAGVDPAALRAMIRKLKRSPEAVIADFLAAGGLSR